MALNIREPWRAKHLAKRPAGSPRKMPRRNGEPAQGAQGQGRRGQGRRKRVAADAKAAAGALPQWTTGRDRGGVPPLPGRRSGARRASSSTSIRSRCWSRSCCPRRRPTPASTRRRRRCSPPPTRRTRWWRSARRRCSDLIKTIGLFRTKAKNVIALSQKLVEEHGGEVPRIARGARGAAGRRPQDRQRRAQHRLRRADHRGRHPHFPRRQPHRAGARQDAVRGRDEARRGGAGAIQAPRPPLADPARPLRLRRAAARCARSA